MIIGIDSCRFAGLDGPLYDPGKFCQVVYPNGCCKSLANQNFVPSSNLLASELKWFRICWISSLFIYIPLLCNNSALKSYNLDVHGTKVFSQAVLPFSLNPA
jgi:hypothetical protein